MFEYRSKHEVFEPDKQAAIQLESVAKIQEELIATEAQLAQVQKLSPNNPQISGLESRAATLRHAIEAEAAKVTSANGSFSARAPNFERLTLETVFADKQLGVALADLETARSEALRQQLYLDRFVQPNLPDKAMEPRRIRSVFAVFLVSLIAWGVVSLLIAAIREHSTDGGAEDGNGLLLVAVEKPGIQRRVLHALLMREIITRFGRENLGVLWLVAEPMLFTLGVATLWTAAGLHRRLADTNHRVRRHGIFLRADVAQQCQPLQWGDRGRKVAPVPSERARHRCHRNADRPRNRWSDQLVHCFVHAIYFRGLDAATRRSPVGPARLVHVGMVPGKPRALDRRRHSYSEIVERL